ncbi:hypothetical protein PT974_07427 [Cladobotryum mycophilum]|uniref:C-type lectin domain-containing protein n=1 Tax=Cladobotryum mycophilum TaxID=491253 RepID=A0ABR0SP83_9HYPO
MIGMWGLDTIRLEWALVDGPVEVLGANPGEKGSWCWNAKNEPLWDAASAHCAKIGGSMGEDRRCYRLSNNSNNCYRSYTYCKDDWDAGNGPGKDKCYLSLY